MIGQTIGAVALLSTGTLAGAPAGDERRIHAGDAEDVVGGFGVKGTQAFDRDDQH